MRHPARRTRTHKRLPGCRANHWSVATPLPKTKKANNLNVPVRSTTNFITDLTPIHFILLSPNRAPTELPNAPICQTPNCIRMPHTHTDRDTKAHTRCCKRVRSQTKPTPRVHHSEPQQPSFHLLRLNPHLIESRALTNLGKES